MRAPYRVRGSAGGHWRCGWRRASSPAGRRAGWVISVGAGLGRDQSRPPVRPSWRASSVVAALGLGVSPWGGPPGPKLPPTFPLPGGRRGRGGTTLFYPFGRPAVGRRRVVWVEITVSRGFAAGETRASEEVTVMDSSIAFSAEAVIPPRRVTVRMWLVRGDTASSRQAMDLVPETTGRRVSFRLGREKLDFDVALERTEAPRTGRDSALAVGVDVVCLRVVAPESPESARVRCGRLDDIARRVALVGGDTLMATFGWPPAR